MIYGTRQRVTEADLGFEQEGFEDHLRESMFISIAKEASKNIKDPIKSTKILYDFSTEFDLRLHIFSENEFNKFMGDILQAINDPFVENKVKNIIRSQGGEPKKAGKKYI
jgi:hypothetical protein